MEDNAVEITSLGQLNEIINIKWRFVRQKSIGLLAKLNQKDLNIIGSLIAEGKLTPVIDRRYSLSEVPDAVGYLEEGHARGKVIIDVYHGD